MTKWNLQPKQGYAHRLGHPWVFSNQLQKSPKNLPAGELVELYDEKGRFISRGYGHPNALISYRELSRNESEEDILSAEFLARRLIRAWILRVQLGFSESSFRWVFAEGDFLPGLIIDRFVQPDNRQLIVIQTSTSGMAKVENNILKAIEITFKEFGFDWNLATIVIAGNSSRRSLEGLPISEPQIVHGHDSGGTFFMNYGDHKLKLHSDFLSGQKTGFFLDQRANVELVLKLLQHRLKTDREPLRVLDLCCYVGQWGAAIASYAKSLNRNCLVTLVDASERALHLAQKNVSENGNGDVQTIKSDVLNGLPQLNNKMFDVIICDPPAFIKKRKDLTPGLAAYQKLNKSAIGYMSAGGLYISCSCSYLLSGVDFQETLAASARKAQRSVQWIASGSQAPDHPIRMEFPEGQYLKCWLGRVNN